jgi:hypothetical protein
MVPRSACHDLGVLFLKAARGEPTPPLADRIRADARVHGDTAADLAAGRSQHDLRPRPVPIGRLDPAGTFLKTLLVRVQVTYRGAFGYSPACCATAGAYRSAACATAARLIPFGYAIYSAASDRYQDALLRTGLPAGPSKKPSAPPAPSASSNPVTAQARDPCRPRRNL